MTRSMVAICDVSLLSVLVAYAWQIGAVVIAIFLSLQVHNNQCGNEDSCTEENQRKCSGKDMEKKEKGN